MKRKVTKEITIGDVSIGGGNKVAVQSMLNASSKDIKKNVEQARRLEEAGCDIIRVAVPDREALDIIPALKKAVKMPIVADIHFDYRLAIESVLKGADKIRINPGNIGDQERVRQVALACRERRVPIRIGVNSGSVAKEVLQKYGKSCPEAMVESAKEHTKLLESFGFEDIVLSLKCSNVVDTVLSYKMMSEETDYPLHLGVTEAGTLKTGMIKSSIGIGSLLLDGIGDTIRVSLTADPVEEVVLANKILRYTGLKDEGVEIISCPTCGRTRIDIINIASMLEEKMIGINKNIKVAVMGCAVNGPGEARDADIGIAGGDGCCLLFKKGQIIRKIQEENILEELIREIELL